MVRWLHFRMDCITSLFLTVVTAIAVMTSQHAGENDYWFKPRYLHAAEMDKRHGRHEKCDWSSEILINGNITLRAEIKGVKINGEPKQRMKTDTQGSVTMSSTLLFFSAVIVFVVFVL